jgi:four helix bundle protein
MHAYRELLLWKEACSLAGEIFRVTRDWVREGDGDLAGRLRAAAMAIPVRIARHYSCDTVVFLRGLRGARQSLLELEHLVQMVNKLHYWPPSQATRISRQLAEIRRHMQAFFHSLAPAPRGVAHDPGDRSRLP